MGGRWVNSTEGHPPFTDQAQTPNCQLTIMDFGGPLLVFEVIGLVDRVGVDGKKYPNNVGNEFYLEAGVIKGGKFYPKGSDKAENLVVVEVKMGPAATTSRTSSTAVRSRKIEDLNADIAEGYLSAACCQLGNISYRLGEQVAGTTKPDVLGKHEEIAKSWDRVLRDRQRRDRSRHLQEHVPAWADADVRSEGGEIRGQPEGRRAADAAVSQAVRRARASIEATPVVANTDSRKGIQPPGWMPFLHYCPQVLKPGWHRQGSPLTMAAFVCVGPSSRPKALAMPPGTYLNTSGAIASRRSAVLGPVSHLIDRLPEPSDLLLEILQAAHQLVLKLRTGLLGAFSLLLL